MTTTTAIPDPKLAKVPMISYYAHCRPGLEEKSLSTAPAKFLLGEHFVREEEEPIRALDSLTLEFEGPGFEQVVLLNFHLTRGWPDTTVAWTPHCDPTILDALKQVCEKKDERTFHWGNMIKGEHVIPSSLRSYVDQFIGADEYAILKFDVLAKERDGHWHFVDPGVGVKRGG